MHIARTVFRDDHEMFRTTARRFFERECVPRQAAWDMAGQVDRETWLKAGREGLLGITLPIEYGGGGGDFGHCAVFNIEGGFCATQARCTHKQGPLSEGSLDGTTVTCPLHGAQFNVWTGTVLRGPAKDPLKTYRVVVDGDLGRVEVPLAQAVQGA